MNDTVELAWEHLREVSIGELEPGDQWFSPEAFTTYSVAKDGTVRGWTWTPPAGTVWTLESYDGTTVTGVRDDIRLTGETGPDRKVLRISN
jgi:hypothetical protein